MSPSDVNLCRPQGVTLLGFAVVDRQSDVDSTAVWLTSREGSRVSHTNAVVISPDDEQRDMKVRALVANRVVVLTDGTSSPVDFAHPIGIRDLDDLVVETLAHRENILAAVHAYKVKSRNKNLVEPSFPAKSTFKLPEHDVPAQRALAAADYVARAWSGWLETDEQRVRRTTDPRSGASPWIMPEELGDPNLAVFPPKFQERARPESFR